VQFYRSLFRGLGGLTTSALTGTDVLSFLFIQLSRFERNFVPQGGTFKTPIFGSFFKKIFCFFNFRHNAQRDFGIFAIFLSKKDNKKSPLENYFQMGIKKEHTTN